MDSRTPLECVRGAGKGQGPGRLGRTPVNRHRLAGSLRAPSGRRADPIPRQGKDAIHELGRSAGEQRKEIHAGADAMARDDSRPCRDQRGDHARRIRLHAFRRAGRVGKGGRIIRHEFGALAG